MTGTFDSHHYEMPAGSSVSSPDIFIIVINDINDGAVPYSVTMKTVAPVGVNINLSKTEFSLNPGERQSISIEIQTTKDAKAGDYALSIKATAHIISSGGVQTLPEVAQNASLTVVGGSNLPLIIGIVCAVAILVIIAYYMVYNSRRRKNINTRNKISFEAQLK